VAELDTPEDSCLQLPIMFVTKIGTARQFMEKLPNIKLRENPFNGFQIFIGVQTD
jgi:hypothetical protein